MENSIAVVTITRGRVSLLKRAIASVQQQIYSGYTIHMIIIDDCVDTRSFLENSDNLPTNLAWFWTERKPEDRSGPPILSVLRNYAAKIAKTQWISFLDDDNEFEPDHLSSLINCAISTGCRAVHSERKLYYADGKPFLEHRSPWCRDISKGEKIYKVYCAEGIFQEGTNIMHDRVLPWDHPKPAIHSVDTGEWLLRRDLLLEFPFATEYSTQDWENGLAEDGKFLLCLLKNKERISSSKKPTLKYYLGGYSTVFSDNPSANFWFI